MTADRNRAGRAGGLALVAAAALVALGQHRAVAQDGAAGGAGAPAAAAAIASITEADLARHVRTLSADEMKGRDERWGGIELAADYVAVEMKRIGLVPAGNDRGSYFQHFSVATVGVDFDETHLASGDTELSVADGWLPLDNPEGEWRGHAIWMDDGEETAYDGLGRPGLVEGAVVFVTSDRRLIEGDARQHVSRVGAIARARGAVGIVHVPRRGLPRSMWRRVCAMLGGPRRQLVASGDDGEIPFFMAWMEPRAFAALVGADTAEAIRGGTMEWNEDGDRTIGRLTGLTVKAVRKARGEPVAYKNVVGRIDGADPSRRDEAVVLTAHYDHIGMSSRGTGDRIFNGADDDASGTAAILEMAEAFVAHPPARSVVVVAFAAEERGLLGSRFFCDHPVVPMERIVADVNVEMIGRPAAKGPGHLWITGHGRSSFGSIATKAAKGSGVTAYADPYPFAGFFERSDNASFARKGVPGHTCSTYDPATHRDYHGPGDEAQKCDFGNMERVTRGIYAIARVFASGDETPQWAEGDPFAVLRPPPPPTPPKKKPPPSEDF